jgi:hypothetical protein
VLNTVTLTVGNQLRRYVLESRWTDGPSGHQLAPGAGWPERYSDWILEAVWFLPLFGFGDVWVWVSVLTSVAAEH